jgi:hypothetical protein
MFRISSDQGSVVCIPQVSDAHVQVRGFCHRWQLHLDSALGWLAGSPVASAGPRAGWVFILASLQLSMQVTYVQVEQRGAERATLPQAAVDCERLRGALFTLDDAFGVRVQVLQQLDGVLGHVQVVQLLKQNSSINAIVGTR